MSWTTNVAEIAPAVAKLGRPLRGATDTGRRLGGRAGSGAACIPDADRRIPNSVRARSLRPKPVRTTRRVHWRRWTLEVVDLLAAAVIVALRRADEMGDAITARGGAGQISAVPSGPKLRDWVALSILLLVCGAAVTLELTVLGTS